jgi:hypothetical protein
VKTFSTYIEDFLYLHRGAVCTGAGRAAGGADAPSSPGRLRSRSRNASHRLRPPIDLLRRPQGRPSTVGDSLNRSHMFPPESLRQCSNFSRTSKALRYESATSDIFSEEPPPCANPCLLDNRRSHESLCREFAGSDVQVVKTCLDVTANFSKCVAKFDIFNPFVASGAACRAKLFIPGSPVPDNLSIIKMRIACSSSE